MNKLMSSSAPKVYFAVRDIIFRICIKESPGADESPGPVLPYNRSFKWSAYVVWTLVSTGLVICPDTMWMNAVKN